MGYTCLLGGLKKLRSATEFQTRRSISKFSTCIEAARTKKQSTRQTQVEFFDFRLPSPAAQGRKTSVSFDPPPGRRKSGDSSAHETGEKREREKKTVILDSQRRGRLARETGLWTSSTTLRGVLLTISFGNYRRVLSAAVFGFRVVLPTKRYYYISHDRLRSRYVLAREYIRRTARGLAVSRTLIFETRTTIVSYYYFFSPDRSSNELEFICFSNDKNKSLGRWNNYQKKY